MPSFVFRDFTYAVLKDNIVQNVIFSKNTGWDTPENTTLVQLYEDELCNIGDTYFGGDPPTRFDYVFVGDEESFEYTFINSPSRLASGGHDDGTLYVGGSVVIGTNGITGFSYYVQFADGTTQDTAAILPSNIVNTVNGATGDVIVVTSINGCTGAIGITGTANEVEVTKVCPNITIGLPDNVTISGNLQVNGNINTNGFIEGLYINGGTF